MRDFFNDSPYWSKPPRDGHWAPNKRLTVNVISDGITRLPVLEGEISHIEIPRLCVNLGITLVGGADTALRCVVIQEVFSDGLIAQDGRLKAGDQIIEINGIDTISASHHQICQMLRKMSPVLRLGVYRERLEAYHSRNAAHYIEEIFSCELEGVGLRLSGAWIEPGVYILEVLNGKASENLQPYDRIISINGENVEKQSLEYVTDAIQKHENATLVIARKRLKQIGYERRQKFSPYKKNKCAVLLRQKSITILKDPRDSLGLRIGGGVGSNEGDIPIYIANIHPQGCVGQTQQVLKGDILLSVNGTSLLGLTHSQAVAILKATVESSNVRLGLLEGPETSFGSQNFIPSWLYWQKLPRCLEITRIVTLKRSSPGVSLGFSIVGGEDSERGPEPIHILFVVQGSTAAIDGKLKCGDRLLAVDGQSLENVKHASAVSMLKNTGNRVILEIVSWLGTEL